MITVCGLYMVELNVKMLHRRGVCVGYVFCISVVFCHLWMFMWIDGVDNLAAQYPSLVLSSWGWPWFYNALPQERKVIISKRDTGAVITS